MNLTFYENNKETRNTSITPFIKKMHFHQFLANLKLKKLFEEIPYV